MNIISKYYVELLTPRQNVDDLDAALEKFVARYEMVAGEGHTISVPDNPMGDLRFQITEVLSEFELTVSPEHFLLHINTFHKKNHLDEILATAIKLGVRNVLLVTGDGGERLPKLRPEDIGGTGKAATSIDLLNYVDHEYRDQFNCGVAFNPYEPPEHEEEKLKKKIDAGATFAITQPIIGKNKEVDRLAGFDLPIVVGAWMSKNLHLLGECIGYQLKESDAYDPIENLHNLLKIYPDAGIYLSLLSMAKHLSMLNELAPSD